VHGLLPNKQSFCETCDKDLLAAILTVEMNGGDGAKSGVTASLGHTSLLFWNTDFALSWFGGRLQLAKLPLVDGLLRDCLRFGGVEKEPEYWSMA
jgi:hypothetical protein